MGNYCCFHREPSYARYHSNTKEVEPNLENVIGSILEMDPSLADREEGVTKINGWIEESAPDLSMSHEHLEISRWKCIKYWEAQHVMDVYGVDYTVQDTKLTGSCVRFYFEKRHGEIPRLVIEHCGRTEVQLKDRVMHTWLLHCACLNPCCPNSLVKFFQDRFHKGDGDDISTASGSTTEGANNRVI